MTASDIDRFWLRPYRSRPVRLALFGAVCLWGLSLGLALLYQTTPGSPIGRIDDYLTEAQPPLRHLFDGHVLQFFQTSPAYVGSLLSRAPFAFLGMGLHADWEIVYCLTSLPCLLAAPILGAWLAQVRPGGAGANRALWTWLSPFGALMLINPILIDTLILGHPEDVIGAALAIAGVVQATRGRERASMLLIALAVVDKSWAVVAAPVALALLPRISAKGLLILCLPPLALYLPVTIIQAHHGGGALGASTGSGTIFLSTQLWWWFGKHSFVAQHAHALIPVTALMLSVLWRLRRRADVASHAESGRTLWSEGLLLLALIMLLRAAMDPWNNVYYCLPFLMCVYALELGRAPRWSFGATLLMVAITIPLKTSTLDTRAIAYQLGTVPLIVGLGLRVFLSPLAWSRLLAALTAERGGTRRSAFRLGASGGN